MLHQQHGIHKVCQYLSNIKLCSILTENTSIFFCAIYNLVIFAFETSFISTLKIKNIWKNNCMHVKQIGMSLEKHKYIVPFVSSYENRIIGE